MADIDNTPRNIQIAFETWCRHASKNVNTRLNDARKKLIGKALEDYGFDTVIDALVGWKFSSYHSGQNDRNTAYNAIELLLRGAKVEQFAEYTRTARLSGLAPPVTDLVAFGVGDDGAAPISIAKRGPGYQGIGVFSQAGVWKPST